MGTFTRVERNKEKNSWTFGEWVRQGVDSVYLERGICTKMGPGFNKPAGNEWVVYSWDQVGRPSSHHHHIISQSWPDVI